MIAAISLGGTFWLAVMFFVISIIAWALGAGGVIGRDRAVGRTMLFVFLILAIIMLVLNFTVNPAHY